MKNRSITAHFSRMGKGTGTTRPSPELRAYLSANGKRGAEARTKALGRERRAEQARKASAARWGKKAKASSTSTTSVK